MAQRQIILDTETTGLRPEEGHRIIEIGCVELINRKLTGSTFHSYLNPNRMIDAGATSVHGITSDFLLDKPTFKDIASDFMQFISDAELIIHNAPFDVSFINNELLLLNTIWKSLTDHCAVLDTLQLARKLHIGQRNSLDALCKRYGIDNSKRDLHGALLDAHLLGQVYLAMTGGQGSFFDAVSETQQTSGQRLTKAAKTVPKNYNLIVLQANEHEIAEHETYLDKMRQKGRCLWLEL
jgi:DNA polymerase III subunit epsilon